MKLKTVVIIITISVLLLSGPAVNPDIFSIKSRSDKVTIAFGSCSHQDRPQPVLDLVTAEKPDLFIYLGDTVYNNSYKLKDLRKSYARLAEKPEFKRLKSSTRILATWDDHDYGWDDSGKNYPYRDEAKRVFLDFFGFPDSSILKHKGIYYCSIFNANGFILQVIMLDTRTFRDNLLPYNGNRYGDSRFKYRMHYSPHIKPGPSILGNEQWKWLEYLLRQHADLRIIASSIQFAVTHNGYESWANFPHEQQRMTELIRRTGAEGVVFISGDVHYAEISLYPAADLYPLYDITSSGITSTWSFATPNDNRIDGPVMENNFGLITVNTNRNHPDLSIEIRDVSGKTRINRRISLRDLTLK